MASKNNKIEEVSTVTNTFFNALKDKAAVKVAGIIKAIEDKNTPYGTAKRFKGDLAIETDGVTYLAKNLFCPNILRDAIISGAAKAGKWNSLEFVAQVSKTITPETETKAQETIFSVSFLVAPRAQKPGVLALLDL